VHEEQIADDRLVKDIAVAARGLVDWDFERRPDGAFEIS
jgi:hypothetical protein